ncbi:MAG: SPOR domain-containing protein [Burkholderiaceae bacterium]
MPQKKRARRRLVGAAALCLATAIALPLLFDAEPRQSPADIQVDIPSRDTPLPSRSGDLALDGTGAAAGGGAGTARDDPSRGLPPLVDPKPADPPATAPGGSREPAAADTGKGGAAKGAPPKPADPAAAAGKGAGAGKAADKAADKAAADKSAADKAAADRAAKAAADKTAKGASADKAQAGKAAQADNRRYVLQIGAFASERGANEQADKVKAAGLSVFTEKVRTSQGERIRVRVGPFPTREQAEQARGQLKLVGIDSALIAP